MTRYSAEHKEAVRERLLRDGGALIKDRGLRGLSLHQMAKSLGLSVAGLYTYFDGRDAMVAALLQAEVDRSVENFALMRDKLAAADDPVAVWNRFVGGYLSLEHVRNPRGGCVMAAIASDMPMQTDALREIYAAAGKRIAGLIDDSIDQPGAGHGALAAVIGAVNLARSSVCDDDARAVLDSALAAVTTQYRPVR